MTTDAITFADLNFKPHKNMSGRHALAFFPNGYGASVICGQWSHGGDEGLYELAVIKGNASGWRLTYETPITDDVIGRLTEEDVTRLLGEVATLPEAV